MKCKINDLMYIQVQCIGRLSNLAHLYNFPIIWVLMPTLSIPSKFPPGVVL